MLVLDRIIRWSIANKLLVGLGTILLVIWGVVSALRLPIDAVPDITNNQIQIITTAPSLATQEVEQLVTAPLERALSNIPDRVEMRSISRFGLSVITVVFDDKVDAYLARQLVGERLSQVADELPSSVSKPELAPMSTGLGEVYQYILRPKVAGKYSAMELRTLQDWVVARQLSGTKGVAEVNSFGGNLKQYEVAVDPNRLRSLEIGLNDVYTALEESNQNTGGAYIDKKPNAFFIRGVGMVGSLDEIGQIAVSNRRGASVLIRDLATLRYGSAIRYGALTHDGDEEVVGGIVMMLKGENSHSVVQSIKARLDEIQQALPSDVIIEPFLDRTDLVDRAISTVKTNLIEAALIVVFVLVLFLGNWRAGLIVASAIPLSMLFALGMMQVFGVSANLMSLGAIDFGLIVDGAVIVVEATLHHLNNRSEKTRLTQAEMDEEVFASASQIRSSATFGEIIILIVYIPILTLVGIEGKMFAPMAMVVSFAIIGALLLSLTYIPMMCACFLSKQPQQGQSFSDKMMQALTRYYIPVRDKSLVYYRWVLAVTLALLVGAGAIFMNMGGEFIPQLQEGDFAYSCVLPQGSSLSQSVETSMQASRIIKSFQEVKSVVGKTGAAEVPTDPMPPEATDIMVILKPRDEWQDPSKSYSTLAEEISHKLEVIPGVFFEANQPIQMRFNELMTGVKQDVAVKVFGENLDTLATLANRIGTIIDKVDGAGHAQVEAVTGLPQINVVYDRLRLSVHGISIQEANDALSAAFAGRVVGQVFEDERSFDVVVRLDSTFRTDIEDVRSLAVSGKDGNLVPLSEVADVNYRLGPAQISREDGKRRVVLGFNVQGRDVASVVADLRREIEQVSLPTGYYVTYGGQFQNLEAASNRLLIAVPLSLLLIFTLLYFTFRSVRWAILIFTAIPMSAIGGVLALLLRGMPFSISAGIGFIALFGVAVLNGIVLVGTFNRLEKGGEENLFVRIRRGTEERLRPVLMTALVASIGFLPMALSTGSGAEVQKPLATVVIGGLISATILTLFVLPILYMIFSKKSSRQSSTRAFTLMGIVLLLGLFSPSLSAQTTILQSAEDAIQRSRKANPDVALRYAAVKHLEGSARELPKLSVQVQYGQYSSINNDVLFNIEQSFPFPTLFKAKKRLLRKTTEQARLTKQIEEQENDAEVYALYQTILYLRERIEQVQHLDSLYKRIAEQSAVRRQAGEDNGINQGLSESKALQHSLELKRLRAELIASRRKLAVLVGVDGELDLRADERIEPLTLEYSAEVEQNLQYKSMQAGIAVLEEERKLALAEAMPEITLGYLNQSLIGNHQLGAEGTEQWYDRGKRFHAITLGVNIPLSWGSTKAKSISQKVKIQAEQIVLGQQASLLEVEIARLQESYQQNMLAYHHYFREGIPTAKRMLESARLSYSEGEINSIDLSAIITAYAEVEQKALEALYQANLNLIALRSVSL